MLLNLQPTLDDELVLLRPLEESDREALYAVAQDPLIWEQHPSKRYQRAVFDDFFRDAISSRGALLVLDKATGQAIGSSRFNRMEGIDSAIEIGWSFLKRAYWGGKYNRAVKKLMIEHAFASVEDVLFHIDLQNIRSQRAVEKLGGKRITGPKHAHLIKQDPTYCTYRINKQAWKV
ncbi:MAG: GNAT family N-acetyltransferase [Tunicatimonas sp.]